MNFEHKDFIGVFSEVYPTNFCEHLISEFERSLISGAGINRQLGENADRHVKDDYQIMANGRNINFADFSETRSTELFFEGLQKCYEIYAEEFSVLKNSKVVCHDMKMQKTSSGGGYHVWHCEQGNDDQARRGIVYSLYLNSLPEEANGETEFLYQQRRIAPVQNTMVLWPASFTHPHRGNPVYGNNSKYIITGWFYYE